MKIKIFTHGFGEKAFADEIESIMDAPDGRWCITHSANQYAVNHAASGIAIVHERTLDQAKASMLILAGLTLNGVSLGDMPGCEITASALLIVDRYVSAGGMLSDSYRENGLLDRAKRLADALECRAVQP